MRNCARRGTGRSLSSYPRWQAQIKVSMSTKTKKTRRRAGFACVLGTPMWPGKRRHRCTQDKMSRVRALTPNQQQRKRRGGLKFRVGERARIIFQKVEESSETCSHDSDKAHASLQ